jgi:hypothetical protein
MFKGRKLFFTMSAVLAVAFGAWAQTAPVLTAPTNGITGEPAAVTLTWGTVAGATSYTLQVATTSTFGTTVLNDAGLTVGNHRITGLATGATYYWEVNETNGTTTSPWSTVWSFSTAAAAAPAVPVLATPANNAVNQATSLTLTWNADARATSYAAELSTVSTFATTVFDQEGLTGLNAAATGLSAATVYYWRVDASNASGTSAWSAARNFTTATPITAPVLVAPSNGATGVVTGPTLQWGTVTGALTYAVQVSTSAAFATLTANQAGLTVASYPITGLANGTTYYWEASATNGTGTSVWSTVWSFTTGSAVSLAAPLLAAPSNGATGVAAALTVSWGSVATATSYSVQVSAATTFAVLTVNQTGVIAADLAVAGLTAGTTYYWRANATDGTSTSVWSTVWSFTVATTAPAAPVLAAPANNAANEPTSLTISWNAAARATGYEAQLSTVSTFATTVFDQAGVTGLNAAVTGLVSGTTYYWRVDASNAAGASAWSAMRNFTTGITAPTLTSPATGATGLGSTVALSWGAVSGVASYTVQLSSSYTFATTVANVAGITGASRTMAGLANSMTYFWRVEAVSATGVASAWSTVAWFTVGSSATLSAEAQGAITPAFNTSHGVISYTLKQAGPVQMAVFDLRGRSVFAFCHAQSAGNYSIELANRSIAAGKYFVWFKAGAFEKRTAMVLSTNR